VVADRRERREPAPRGAGFFLPGVRRGEKFRALSRNRPSPARSAAPSRRRSARRVGGRARVVATASSRAARVASSRADPVFTVLFLFVARIARARGAATRARADHARGAARKFAPKKFRQNG
jgi:hypothetical protein